MSSPSERRVEQFESEIASLRLRTGRRRGDVVIERIALAAMIGGLVVAVIAYLASLDVTATPGSNVDVLDSNSHQILAVISVGIALAATIVYVRYSMARFLRVWLLRQIYEQRTAIDEAQGRATE